MSSLKTAVLIALFVAVAFPGMTSEKARKMKEEEPGQGARLEALFKDALHHPEKRDLIRIEASGQLASDLHFLTLYGRGIGFWNRERQFRLDDKQVAMAIRIVLKHKLARLPENIGGEEEEETVVHGDAARPPHERNGKNPQRLLRTLILSAGELSRPIVQEAEVPEAAALEKGLSELASLCRKPAAKGIAAHDLEEGLALIASGKLAPEALVLSVNAPQLRSLKDNTGQGWILRIEHGRIIAQSQTLDAGYRTVTNRLMEPKEVRELAKRLLAAGVQTLPGQVNTPGYLHLRLRVLSSSTQVMARPYASKPTPEAVSAFSPLRSYLHSIWKGSMEKPDPVATETASKTGRS